MRVWLVPILLSALAFGCHRSGTTPTEVTKRPEIAIYETRGTIRKINPASHTVVIAHEEIPGYMAAMAMEFDAADAHELAGLQVGDVVTFRLSVEATRSWIDQLHKVGTSTLTAGETPRPETAL